MWPREEFAFILASTIVSVRSPWPRKRKHLFSVQITPPHPAGSPLPLTLFPFCLFVSPRFLSWGGEFVCGGRGDRDSSRLGLSKQFSDFPKSTFFFPSSFCSPFLSVLSSPLFNPLLSSYASLLLGSRPSLRICVDIYLWKLSVDAPLARDWRFTWTWMSIVLVCLYDQKWWCWCSDGFSSPPASCVQRDMGLWWFDVECRGTAVGVMGWTVSCEDKVFLEVYLTLGLVARPQ